MPVNAKVAPNVPDAELKEWPAGSGYWAYNKPLLKTMVVNTQENVLSGAGDHGFDIGDIGSPTSPVIIIIDENEHDQGDYRIYDVPVYHPLHWFPAWTQRLIKRGIVDPKKQEYWVNGSHLIPAAPSNLTGKVVMTTTLDLATMTATTKVELK